MNSWPTLPFLGSVARRRPPSTPAAGLVLPGYEILDELGRGGMGVVYKARQTKLHRLVAIKMILAGAYAGPDQLRRFRQEAEAVARLQHPHIVQIYEVGEHEGRPFFSLEFVEGGSLAQRLDGTPQPPQSAARIVEQLAQAIQVAHEHGIIHRDLKPANILLTRNGTPKITDFGLAKQLEIEETPVGLAGAKVLDLPTATGAVLGTPSYMAPEQAQGKVHEIGPAADVYALGAILYELLAGRPPFKGATQLETLVQVTNAEPVAPTRLQPKLPRDLETICLKCLQKEPKKRYASALALAGDLHRYLANEPIMARPGGTWERMFKWAKRRPAVAALLAVVVLVTTAGFGGLAIAWREAETARDQAVAERQKAEEARKTEEEHRKEAEEAQKQADAARQAEAAQKRQFQRLSANLLLDRGQALCEQEDIGRGLLWLSRSLQIAPADDADLQRVIRMNLADWQRHFHPLRYPLSAGRSTNWAAVLSRDGKVLLTESMDHTARLWETATGKPIGQPMKNKAAQGAVAFSPDGKTILAGSSDGTAQLWDATTCQPIGKPLPHPVSVTLAAFSPTGKALLTASADQTVRLWEASTGQPIGSPLQLQGEAILAVVFSPDGKTVATACRGANTAHIWEAATGKPIGQPLQHQAHVHGLAFSPTGKVILTGSADTTARLWNAATGQPIGQPMQHDRGVYAVAFSPNGRCVLTGSADKTARLWDAATGRPIGRPMPHQAGVWTVALSPDGKTGLTGSEDQTARLWDLNTRLPLGAPLPHQSPVTSVAFTPDNKTVLTRSYGPIVRLWDVAVSPPLGFPLGIQYTHSIAFSPDGQTVLAGSLDKMVRLWNVATGKPLRDPLPSPDRIRAVAISSDGRLVLAGGDDKTVRRWDGTSGKPIEPSLELPGIVLSLAISPDRKTIAVGTSHQGVWLWDAFTGKPIGQPLKHPDEVLAVAFSSDSKTLVTGAYSQAAQLWNVATGERIGKPLLHRESVKAVAISPDGQTVLTGSDDRTARLWQAATGNPVHTPFLHPRGVTAVAFSPDGKTILTGSLDDQKARLWDVFTGKPLGMPFDHRRPVWAVAFSSDGKTALSASPDKAGFWPVPVPLPGEVERLVLWAQVQTGMELDADGVVAGLDAAQWQERRKRLEELGGPPGPAN